MKTKKKIKICDIRVNSICGQAKQFMDASLRCYPGIISDGILEGPIAPAVVCNAFAVELWLKALYCIENPNDFVPHGHDLLQLFKKLPIDTQRNLLSFCEYKSEQFNLILGNDAMSFDLWRYAYEHGAGSDKPAYALSVNFILLRKLGVALNDVCEKSLKMNST